MPQYHVCTSAWKLWLWMLPRFRARLVQKIMCNKCSFTLRCINLYYHKDICTPYRAQPLYVTVCLHECTIEAVTHCRPLYTVINFIGLCTLYRSLYTILAFVHHIGFCTPYGPLYTIWAVLGQKIPGQNKPGQNIPGKNIPGQNIPDKTYPDNHTRTKYTGQYIPDKIYRTKYTGQNKTN